MCTSTLRGWLLPALLLLALPATVLAQTTRTHDTGLVQFDVYDNGFLGSSNTITGGVAGFTFNGRNGLFEGQLLVGRSATEVCGEAYTALEWANTQPFTTLTPPFSPPYEEFDEGYRVAFNCSTEPLPIEVVERSYSRTGDGFVVAEFEVANTSGAPLTGIHTGAFADFDVSEANYDENLCDFDAGTALLYCWDPTGENPNYYGVAALSGDVSGWEFDVGAGLNPTEANLWTAMTNGGDTTPTAGADRRTVLGTGPHTIPAGGSVTVQFAFVGGTSEANILANAAAAQAAVAGAECDLELVGADLSYDAGTRTLTVQVAVRNNGNAPLSAQLLLDYNRNGGNPQGTRNLGSGTLPPGPTVNRTLTLRVPAAAPAGNYNFTLRLVDVATGNDCDSYAETIAISAPRVGGGEGGELFGLDHAVDLTPTASAAVSGAAVAPNPFARQTAIRYEVAAAADVRLAVYDLLGREVAVLVDARQEAGVHTATFAPRGLAAGTYVYRLVIGSDVQTGRMTLTR